MILNRNKRGTAITESEAGRAILRRMLATADVVLENFRPAPWKNSASATTHCVRPTRAHILPAHRLRDHRSVCRSRRFRSHRPGMSGLMSLTGEGRPPAVKVGVPITDMTLHLAWLRFSRLCAPPQDARARSRGIAARGWHSAYRLAKRDLLRHRASPGRSARRTLSALTGDPDRDGWINVAPQPGELLRLIEVIAPPI